MSVEDDGWGQPTAKHFVRRYIVDVRYDGATVHVHRDVAHLMAAFLVSIGETFQEVPATTIGWLDVGDAYQRRGLRLDVPGLRWSDRLYLAAARLGLTVGEGFVQFEGAPHEAAELTRHVIEAHTDAEASVASGFVDRYRPGTRQLAVGDSGPDVYFLQEYLRCGDVDSVFGHELEQQVKLFQEVRGLPETGVCDRAFWLAMFPERAPQVEPGDANIRVRMVQALLVALDYTADPITNQYGTRTTRSVREMQKLHRLRPTGIIRAPEWGVLVHRPVDGFPLQD